MAARNNWLGWAMISHGQKKGLPLLPLMTRKASLRIETKLASPMDPVGVLVCTDEKLIAIVSLADFDRACEALDRVRHNHFVKQQEAEADILRCALSPKFPI